MMTNLAILGSTGSIGQTTLKVATHLGIKIVALSAYSQIDKLIEQIKIYKPEYVAIGDEIQAQRLKELFPHLVIGVGQEGYKQLVSLDAVESVVIAITGTAALIPTLKAIEARKKIALASKEVLVCAGELVMQKAKELGVPILPIDSEHSAVFQCLQGQSKKEVKKITLTASGGPFLKFSKNELEKVSVQQALKHPNWQMGAKVTIDSSTLMNKALEMIEAYYLFDLKLDQIGAIIHPQSYVHCFVEWVDGNLIAHLHNPDMSYPIQYALAYPNRVPGMFPSADFSKYAHLEFLEPDTGRFLAINFAYEVLKKGLSYPCYMNAANEVLVQRFLKQQISWMEISVKLEALLARHAPFQLNSLDAVLEMDKQARLEALSI
jgi:1-deoxy-D-xylulose-5-phosphate reductoisomerase